MRPREPITAKLVADMISAFAGADRIFAIDLHAGQIQGFFDIPVDHLPGQPLLAGHLQVRKGVCGKERDCGFARRGRRGTRHHFGGKTEFRTRHRRQAPPRTGQGQESWRLSATSRDSVCVLIDDMIDSGGTFVAAAHELSLRGAKEIYGAATHAVLSGEAIHRIQNSEIQELVVTDTIPIAPERMIRKITQLSVAKVCAEAIVRIHQNDSVSGMFSAMW